MSPVFGSRPRGTFASQLREQPVVVHGLAFLAFLAFLADLEPHAPVTVNPARVATRPCP
jgi:hypothetical protein